MSIQVKGNNDHQERKILKFLVLGDSKIGKTSILERYVNKHFKDNYIVTIGMDVRIKKLSINNIKFDIYITDTAGQERFRSISKMSYKGADGILIGFALNDEKTIQSVNYWVEQIYENKGKNSNVALVLFGNKCDDEENICIEEEQINKVKSTIGLQYFKTSAKDNINIQELFEYLIKQSIIKKGFLKDIGLDENCSMDDINIIERIEEVNSQQANKKKKKNKKKNCC